MMFGFVRLENGAVVTHRDSYLLSKISVVSVRPPFREGASLLSAGLVGFGLVFGDLLYANETAVIVGTGLTLLLAGFKLAQLTLLSRDLKGTEQSSVVWGSHGKLQAIRHEILLEQKKLIDGDSLLFAEHNRRNA